MASEKQIEANRRNAARSTGPKTAEGKARVRLNALKHGLTASTVVLPGEDAAALEARVDAWREDFRPAGAMEDYLLERAAHASWQLDRADRAIAARARGRMHHEPEVRDAWEGDEVAILARALFWDRRGPLSLYPHARRHYSDPRISWTDDVDDPLDPPRILRRLEAFAAGCRWLLDRWGELRMILEDGRKWQPPDRFRAVRLLGKQPLDALDDETVLSIYLACRAMDPKGPPAFADQTMEMVTEEADAFHRRVEGRGLERHTPANPAAGRAVLLEILDRARSRLEGLIARNVERESAERAAVPDRLAFDDTEEGERLRRYHFASGRMLFRTIGTLLKLRKGAAPDPGLDEASLAANADVSPRPTPIAPVEEPVDSVDETNPIAAVAPAARVPAAGGRDGSDEQGARDRLPEDRPGSAHLPPVSSADRRGVEPAGSSRPA